MRLLHVTPQPPEASSGGGLCVRQSALMIQSLAEVDYLGPEIPDAKLSSLYGNKYLFRAKGRIREGLMSALQIERPGYFADWQVLRKQIEWKKYEGVYLDFTKLFFVAKEAAKHDIPIIVRVHNIERDYYHDLMMHSHSPLGAMKYIVQRQWERRTLNLAAATLFLTKDDQNRASDLYGLRDWNQNCVIIPVAVDCGRTDSSGPTVDGALRILYTGSLWSEHNHDGILWFINNVWPRIGHFCELTIAGANPSPKLINEIRYQRGITLVANPSDVDVSFLESHMYILPVFWGSGMKVRIAQALSYGLPVVATDTALVGYSIMQGRHGYRANTNEEFVKSIETYRSLATRQQTVMRSDILELFREEYSIESAKRRMGSALQAIRTWNSRR